MTERRTALIVATDRYADPTFQRLHAPTADATSLAAVLSNAGQNRYQVTLLCNESAATVNRTVEHMLVEAQRDDVFLFYFSGHGVKDDAGNLYLATVDSEHLLPGSTMVAAHFVRAQLDRSHSARKIVLLDCCFGGAFPRGHLPRGPQRAEVLQQLTGQGCAVLTASSALEYAYESDGNDGKPATTELRRSFFTSALVDGLRTGAADLDGDGWIDSDELYRYVTDELRTSSPRQKPSYDCKFTGRLVVAASPRGPRLGFGLPDEIVQAVQSSLSRVRVAAVAYLLDLATDGKTALFEHALTALDSLTGDPDAAVREAATNALGTPPRGRRFRRATHAAVDARSETDTHAEAASQVYQRAAQLEQLTSLFINVTSRSQALVERQLRLTSQLREDEQDPDRLADLLELDHLAARIRHNSESVLALSGRRFAKLIRGRVPIGELIRAAVYEIEQYGRVEVGPAPDVTIPGGVVNDLIHLMAELLDNATAFSAPDTKVTVHIDQARTHGLLIRIIDRGIGIAEQDLRTANERLTSPPVLSGDLRRMGLFVVERLALPHGITVTLQHNTIDDGGTIALVFLLPRLLTGSDTDATEPMPVTNR